MKNSLLILMLFLSHLVFAQSNFSLTFNESSDISAKSNSINQLKAVEHIGFRVGVGYGRTYGNLDGLNTIIDNYNERNADKLLEEMPQLKQGQQLHFTSQLTINHIFMNIGYLMTPYQTHSVLNDRAAKVYRHRHHFNLQGRAWTTQVGYVFYPNNFIMITLGGEMAFGNYRFITGTFEPTRYENFPWNEIRTQPKHKTTYAGGFGRIMFGNPEVSKLAVFVEGQYSTLINQVNLEAFNETLNPTTFQNDDNANLNLEHNYLAFRVGLVFSFKLVSDYFSF